MISKKEDSWTGCAVAEGLPAPTGLCSIPRLKTQSVPDLVLSVKGCAREDAREAAREPGWARQRSRTRRGQQGSCPGRPGMGGESSQCVLGRRDTPGHCLGRGSPMGHSPPSRTPGSFGPGRAAAAIRPTQHRATGSVLLVWRDGCFRVPQGATPVLPSPAQRRGCQLTVAAAQKTLQTCQKQRPRTRRPRPGGTITQPATGQDGVLTPQGQSAGRSLNFGPHKTKTERTAGVLPCQEKKPPASGPRGRTPAGHDTSASGEPGSGCSAGSGLG